MVRRLGRGRPRSLLVVCCTAVLLAACWGDDPATAPPSPTLPSPSPGGGSLRWGIGAEPASLDPARIVRRSDEQVIDALFDSLTTVDESLSVQPALATSWTSSADAMEWRFTLDPDARWSDGTPVVARDVVRGLSRVADGSAPLPSLHAPLLAGVAGADAARDGAPLRGVRAVDDATVAISLVRPDPDLPLALSHPALAPVPPQAVDDPLRFGEAPIGNGPYVLAEPWAHNQFLRLVPAPDRTDDAALEELVFRVYADDTDGEVRWADLAAGQIQVTDVPLARRDEIAGVARARPLEQVLDVTSVLLMDVDQPLTGDVRFRRAVASLVDRDGVAARTNGARVAADSITPPSLPDALSAPCRWCRHAPAAAAELVAAVRAEQPEADRSGTDADEEPLHVVTPDDPVSATIAQQIRGGLRQLDVQARVESVPAASLPAVVEEDDPAIVVLPWSPSVPSTEWAVVELVGPGGLGRMMTGWDDPAVDELVAEVWSAPAPAERVRSVHELERLTLDEAVVVPLLHARSELGVAVNVSDLHPAPDGGVDLTTVRIG